MGEFLFFHISLLFILLSPFSSLIFLILLISISKLINNITLRAKKTWNETYPKKLERKNYQKTT